MIILKSLYKASSSFLPAIVYIQGEAPCCILQNNARTRRFRGAKTGGLAFQKFPATEVDCIGLEHVETEWTNKSLEFAGGNVQINQKILGNLRKTACAISRDSEKAVSTSILFTICINDKLVYNLRVLSAHHQNVNKWRIWNIFLFLKLRFKLQMVKIGQVTLNSMHLNEDMLINRSLPCMVLTKIHFGKTNKDLSLMGCLRLPGPPWRPASWRKAAAVCPAWPLKGVHVPCTWWF